MSVGLLTITHDDIGRAILDTALFIMGTAPIRTFALSVQPDADPNEVLRQAARALEELDSGDGVLVLTDLFGATPGNVANRLRDPASVRVLAGINLPMVVRAFNYANLDLSVVAQKALEGARSGIVQYEQAKRLSGS